MLLNQVQKQLVKKLIAQVNLLDKKLNNLESIIFIKSKCSQNIESPEVDKKIDSKIKSGL